MRVRVAFSTASREAAASTVASRPSMLAPPTATRNGFSSPAWLCASPSFSPASSEGTWTVATAPGAAPRSTIGSWPSMFYVEEMTTGLTRMHPEPA